ncbi:heat shock 22 kDa protein, mitochondrial-like isoform X1 [Musa acuminata AAA Group]|uniref:heat shock 22 kDa protein, mitochondrial isoform X1 n=1 Tax=Musa acuminata AAA Group TaxID=214697 RepID=UPI0008A0A347|nr:PREDICTED: heat shock 22 kDa protein, mitochondrial isoform X1 [Musa acuminata subsp. malaccensis]
MAAMIASRSAALSKLVERLLVSPGRPVAAATTRLFSTGTLRDYDDDNRDVDLERRPDSPAAAHRRRADSFPSLQGKVFDPFNPTRSLSQVLNLMDQMLDNPIFAAAGPSGAAGGLRRGWDAREDEHALHLRVDMPGLGKEHVKVWAEHNTLVIKGESDKEAGEEGEESTGRRYSSRIDLPPESYRLDQIRAEMKNGVLKVVVPKVKEEERKDVFQVNIE